MAARGKAGKTKKVAVAGGKDCFQDLPEPVLELLLSFLPSRDAVRTSVLARRWRTLWKSVPALRFYPSQFDTVQAFNNFVNTLLEHRDRTSPLHECDIFPYPHGQEDEARRYVESWVQYAVSCQVYVLRVKDWSVSVYGSCLNLSSSSVISRHLTRLEFYHLAFDRSPLDLLSCQALELLDIGDCSIKLWGVFPKSLRHLKIRYSSLYSMQTPWSCFSAPGLLTFELADPHDWALFLESLTSLVTSFIRIGEDCEDNYAHYNYLGDSGNELCEDNCCVFLEGLAGATNLELISEYSMIFRKDLKWCPMFSKLKTLLPNEWCLTANFTGLLHFLQHTPILEKLTLQLPSRKDFDIVSSRSYNPAEYFLVSKHLKEVEIHCSKEDEWICQIVKILGIHGVTSAQISIKHDSWSSFRFSFQQPK
ncbi:putative F-box/FBD/LRR-repeat protein At5g22670 [Triticum urartu]|uniref:F-box domain-containing protein n=1 Tax=Triticum urartu TaxID=4572 RepID=A0A8R7PNE2_TRIUA|nr:putative F-box/FBD/LRR-repeat protein At5g22670 [Triticum urartu]